MSNDLEITFVHPTDSAQTFKADVSPEQTSDDCIEQLVAHDFFERQAGRIYRLSVADGEVNRELKGDETLGEAGVQSGSALHVFASTQGATSQVDHV